MSFFLVSFFSITNYTQVIDLWLFLLLHHFTDVTQNHPLVATLLEKRWANQQEKGSATQHKKSAPGSWPLSQRRPGLVFWEDFLSGCLRSLCGCL